MDDLDDLLEECIDNFGPAPRHFGFFDRWTYMRLPRPAWLTPADQLTTLFDNLAVLWREGVVVWGHVIQANGLLFQPGNDNCPGEVVYSVRDADRVTPAYLALLAQKLHSLKGTRPSDADLAPIAEYLTNEMIRVFGLKVPPAISPNYHCRISTTFFVRKHLPSRLLCNSLLPIVVHPEVPFVVLPLPERYWPTPLMDWWEGLD